MKIGLYFNRSIDVYHFVFSALMMLSVSVMADSIDLPYEYPRTNANLISNSVFNGTTTGWVLASGPVYDAVESHTAGSGSVRFVSHLNQVDGDFYAQLKSEPITNFKYDTPYTISYYLKAQHEPVYVTASLHMYDAADNRTFSYTTGVGANSAVGEWQEITEIVTITDPLVVKVLVVISIAESASYESDFFIDDVYFGEGISFAEAPTTTRNSFSGAKVEVDKLGNWSVFESGAWKDYFPFGLYVDLARTDYNSLSAQGFNVVMSQQFASQVQKAKDALSTFNPNGMNAALRLARYAVPGDDYWTLDLLGNMIDDITLSELSDTLLFYDWDNENNWTTWTNWQDMINVVRSHDINRPVYILNGNPALQRLFNGLSDVSGTYVGPDLSGTYENGVWKFEVLQNLEKQTTPVSIAQINEVNETPYGFRLRVYDALIKGARGIIWWGDSVDHVENRIWWPDVSSLRSELDLLLPILKQPHWTSWSVTSSDETIRLNSREYNGDGYIIVMNQQDVAAVTSLTLSGYSAMEVMDYFSNDYVTEVNADSFSVSIPANSTAVYKLVALDTDRDGLSDVDEVAQGTNPAHSDSDYDGENDLVDEAPSNLFVPNGEGINLSRNADFNDPDTDDDLFSAGDTLHILAWSNVLITKTKVSTWELLSNTGVQLASGNLSSSEALTGQAGSHGAAFDLLSSYAGSVSLHIYIKDSGRGRDAKIFERFIPLIIDGGTGGDVPPIISIIQPLEGASFNMDDSITFEGAATDLEDNDISANLVWTSNLDGVIGMGSLISTTSLTVGAHVITSSVTDSGENTVSTSVTVNVLGATGSCSTYTSRKTCVAVSGCSWSKKTCI